MSRLLTRFFKSLSDFLNDPAKVIVFCIVVFFFNLVFDGSLFNLWKLYRESEEIKGKIVHLESENRQLQAKIIKASDPKFIETQARQRFNMVSEGDLLFIFSDD